MANLKDLIVNGAARVIGKLYASEFVGKLTGNADTATKLGTTTVGSTSQPIYLDGGTPTKISYTIGANVPADAVFTDTKVTSVGNHYNPSADSSSALSVDASSTTSASWASTSLVTGVDISRDAKGHVTGLAVDSIRMPAIADNLTTDDNTVSLSAKQGKLLNEKIADFDYRGRSNTWSAVNTFSSGSDVTSASSTASGAIIASNGGIWAAGGIRGNKVYNAVWNDLADCIPVDEDCELAPGYCYCFNGEKYYKSSKYLDDGIIGIHSDTYGIHMGYKDNYKQMDVAVAGFVLAYVDQEYPVGTPLTCTENGYLTKIERSDKIEYPEKIVATYWKSEPSKYWGGEKDKIKVNGRKWVRVN